MTWILDTDTVTLFEKQNPLVKQRVNQVSIGNIAVTVITVEEQMRGWLDAIRKSSNAQRLAWGYLGLRQGVEFFNTLRVLDFDEKAIDCYRQLKEQKIRIGAPVMLKWKNIIVNWMLRKSKIYISPF